MENPRLAPLMIKALRRLEQRYKLIKFESRYAKEETITLLDYEVPETGDASIFLEPGMRKIETSPISAYFELPDDYFDFGWNRILSFRAKFCYFINLAYSSISDTKPYWLKV